MSHGLAQVEQLCERAAWIEYGDLEMLGNAVEVVKSYTGSSHDARVEPDEIGTRWGSGEVQITSLMLLDEQHQPVQVVRSGQRLVIGIGYTAHTLVEDIVIGVSVHYLHGQLLVGANTRRRGLTIDRAQGSASVEFRMDHFPLLEGVYDLTANVADSTEVHPYDFWDKRVRFEVDQSGIYDFGSVVAQGSWAMDVKGR